MPLTAGTRLGAYEVLAAIGAGGMGEVFRARDTTLNRDVAIKVIPDVFAGDPDRLARFEREAQALAALNHPNIAQVYGLERQQPSFIVMELVDGEELADRIARGPIPLDEAMPIAAQIAEALEAAHEQGIIHRDLKPANIKIRHDGTVKVLDFGLAKAMDATAAPGVSASISPTLSVHATQAGIILGTAAYMSPEQARGRPVDKRADIWAFGVVLYEMVTGGKPFDGDDVGEVLAGVIKEQPKWGAVPVSLRRLLQRCLEKDPKKRLRDISGVGLLLEEPTAAAPARARASMLPWITAASLAIVAAVALWAPWRRTAPELRPLVRLDVDLGNDASLGSLAGADVIISPDGRRLVWVSQSRLFTRRLDQPKALELAGTQGAFAPFFSPDGQWIAFFAAGSLKKVSVEGGTAISLCVAGVARGGTWGEDGRIVFALDRGLQTVPESGGNPEPLIPATQDGGLYRWPQFLPGGKAVLVTNRAGNSLDDTIEAFRIDDRRRIAIHRGATFGRYVRGSRDDGYVLYVNRGTLFALPFDADRLEARGAPSPVVEGVGYNNVPGSAQFDVSHEGTLIYRSLTGGGVVFLQWLTADGKTEALPAKPDAYTQPRFSPDGKRLAVSLAAAAGQDLWVYDLARDAWLRLTFGGGQFGFPVWTPDGRYLVYTAGQPPPGGMLWTRSDGATKPAHLFDSKNGQFPWSFSPDGKQLAYAEFGASGRGGGDIWTVPVTSGASGLEAGKPEEFLRTPANELYPAISPDGRWIAYRTLESGTSEIEVRAFPNKGGKWLVSNSGGVIPVWSPNGRELFYRTEDQRIMVVSYRVNGDAFVPDKPRQWTEKRLAEYTGRNFDIAPDGTRLIGMMGTENPETQQAQSHVIFLQNFDDELRRRLAAVKR